MSTPPSSRDQWPVPTTEAERADMRLRFEIEAIELRALMIKAGEQRLKERRAMLYR